MSSKRSPAPGLVRAADAGVRDERVERAVDRREHLVAVADVARLRDGAGNDVRAAAPRRGRAASGARPRPRAGARSRGRCPCRRPVTTTCLPSSRVNGSRPRRRASAAPCRGRGRPAGPAERRRSRAHASVSRIVSASGRVVRPGGQRALGRDVRHAGVLGVRAARAAAPSTARPRARAGTRGRPRRARRRTRRRRCRPARIAPSGLRRADGVVRAGGAALGGVDDPGGQVAAVDDLRRARRRARGRARRRPRRCASASR